MEKFVHLLFRHLIHDDSIREFYDILFSGINPRIISLFVDRAIIKIPNDYASESDIYRVMHISDSSNWQEKIDYISIYFQFSTAIDISEYPDRITRDISQTYHQAVEGEELIIYKWRLGDDYEMVHCQSTDQLVNKEIFVPYREELEKYATITKFGDRYTLKYKGNLTVVGDLEELKKAPYRYIHHRMVKIEDALMIIFSDGSVIKIY